MRCSRRVPVLLAMWIAIALGSAGGVASSALAQTQERLASQVISAEELTASHRQQIAAYVNHWADRLTDADEVEVTDARRQLVAPLGAAGRSDTFVNHYSERVAERLTSALESDRQVVRLNAMIVVTRLSSGAAMPLIERGMQDPSAAVRYWAVKTARTATFTDAQRRQLLDWLAQHLETETEAAVAEQAMHALLGLNLDQVLDRVLAVLNVRVELHLASPDQPLYAEHTGMFQSYRQLAAASAPDRQSLRQLARAAVRYQELAARRLEADDLNELTHASYVRMLELCDSMLRFVHGELNAGSAPASSRQLIQDRNWPAVRQNAEQWRELMQRPPFQLTDEELGIESP